MGFVLTVVELFDKTPIENLIGSLTTVPDRVIYIGENWMLEKFEGFYEEFVKNRDIEIEVEYRSISKNDLGSIVAVLTEIVENEQECIFDLTGGEDLVLVAMGMVYSRFCEKRNIKMQRFNIRGGKTVDCDNDGEFVFSGLPRLSVSECIRLHGGTIRYKTPVTKDGTYDYNLTPEFCCDIDKLWNIARKNPGSWNKQFIILTAINKTLNEEDLEVSINLNSFKENLEKKNVKYFSIHWLLNSLARARIILNYQYNDSQLKFRYKNLDIKKALSAAGTILELKVLKTGKFIYSDAKSGVYIDWDGKLHPKESGIKDTENEIDVIFMDGIIPIFISCKNGEIKDDELYKFDAVATRFGGTYAKKVLIATYLNKKPASMKDFR